jgi:hypothetical protein
VVHLESEETGEMKDQEHTTPRGIFLEPQRPFLSKVKGSVIGNFKEYKES